MRLRLLAATADWALALGLAFGLCWAGPAARAQDTLTTQKTVPLGGADIRGLPDRDRLPPPFGANLFPGSVTAEANKQQGATVNPTATAAAGTGTNTQAGNASAGNASAGNAGAGSPAAAGCIPFTAGSGPQSTRNDVNPDYLIQPGDKITLHVFGAVTIDDTLTVDGNGEVFIPSVGAVHVAGLPSRQVQTQLAEELRRVYLKDVNVYATLATATPINVFVTGAVLNPGQYSGSPADSPIAFLRQACGVDSVRGSYRDIQILRGGHPIARVDLYQFLLHGKLPREPLHGGDTILVGRQGPTVIVRGTVRGPFRYELSAPYVGAEVSELARPYPETTHVELTGIRNHIPQSYYLTTAQFAAFEVRDSDIIEFRPDLPADVITVSVEGRVQGPTNFVVRRDATLLELLSYIPVDANFAETKSVYLRRVSIAEAQKKAILDALERLQRGVATSPTITEGEAAMRAQEAPLIDKFVDQAKNVEPEGRVIVSHDGVVGNVRLEDQDVIVIPSRTDLVLIGGEVSIPQSIVYVPDADIRDYIELAGGWTERADRSRILVQRQSGETTVSANPTIQPGDQVMVLPRTNDYTIPILKDVTQIIYQIAVGAGVLVALHSNGS
ncbi:MAG: polysaccharide biosynthesis/export family protein [Alphaproteobacteria bacterium]|nr:polysaccharide biosynthesis/export family protein [Alphaproteobacteria bacterium]